MRCLITGGSRGLGRALCVTLARAGARIAFTYRRSDADADETERLVAELGGEPRRFRGSVADADHVKDTVNSLIADWGGIDVLINNAAITHVVPFAMLEEKDWDELMAVNVKGAYLFSRAVLRSMIRARRGHILSIGSFGTDRVIPAPVHYAASKAALVGFTKALAAEVGRYGIAVNLLIPGLLDTGISRRLPAYRRDDYVEQSALGRLGTAEEVAELALWLVSEKNSLMTGARVVLDGGL